MAIILDGIKLAKKVREELKVEVDKLKSKGIYPKLAVIMVGDNSSSQVYVKNKSKACKNAGIEFEEFIFDKSTSEDKLLETIKKLNDDDTIHGILLQSPVPDHININKAFRTISPEKDVDGFNPVNVGNLSIGEDCFISCTPYRYYETTRRIQDRNRGEKCSSYWTKQYSGKTYDTVFTW